MGSHSAYTYSHLASHTGSPSSGMVGSVVFALAFHASVGGAFWLGNAFGVTQPAYPLSDVIMVEMVNETLSPAPPSRPMIAETVTIVETAEVAEAVRPPDDIEPEQQDEAFVAPPSDVIENDLSVSVADERPVSIIFDVPEEKPAPPPLPVPEPASASVVLSPTPTTQPAPPASPAPAVPLKQQSAATEMASAGAALAHEAAAVYVHNPKPAYPHKARRLRQEGIVVLLAEIGSGGQVLAISLKESSGHRLLDKTALRAVATWRFAPATRGGVPIRSTVEIPIRFFLDES